MTRLNSGLFLFFLIVMTSAYSQNTVSVSGGNAHGTGGVSSYTVGQTTYSSFESANGSVAQGIQLPFEISTIVGEKINKIDLKMVALPNPVSNQLQLHISSIGDEPLNYHLYDIEGRLLQSNLIVREITQLDVTSYSQGIYLLKVKQGNLFIKTFKIIKNSAQ